MDPIDNVLAAFDNDRQSWGGWRLHAKVRVLAFYLEGRWRYEVDLDRCRTCAQVLDWIYQLDGKPWLSNGDLRDFLKALDDVLGPIQANYCPGGQDMTRERGGRDRHEY